jgi:all-trans-retinol dehydrogenase (NAD+)
MTTISSKHVLITGSARGIGRRLAEKMSALGAHVSMWDMDEACLAGAAAGITAGGGLVREYCCDVSDRAAVDRLATQTIAEGGPVDIVVNNAGVVSGRPLLELTPEQIERTLKVNVLALFWVTRAFLPAMIERGGGHIVTVASAAGLIGVPRQTDYGASKHAAVGFDESLRMELRRSAPGVMTTVVCPSYIDTGMFAGVTTRFPLLLPILKEEKVADAIVRAIQLNRRRVMMPFMVRTVPLMRLLPVSAFDWVADFLGIAGAMDEFVGRGPAA